MEPLRRTSFTRRWGWVVERSLYLASVMLLVGSAGLPPGTALEGAVFVSAAVLCFALVVLAWVRDDVTTREVLVLAVLARLVAFPLLPGLSDDGFRYVWDGWMQAEGINPYLFRPSEAALAEYQQSEVYNLLNSARYYSVYPPSSQLIFWLGGFVTELDWRAGWYAIKAVFLAIELGGVWALSRLVAPRALVLYAWHPLVLIEGAGQSHTEAGMVGFLLLALLAYRRDRPRLSVAALTVAGWFKLYPLVLLPFLLRRVGWRRGWVAVVVSAALLLPYANPAVPGHIAESLDLYVRLFEFNAGPYFFLKGLGGLWSGEDVSKILGPALRGLFLVGLAGLFLADRRRNWALPTVWLLSVGWLWATATTVHPWYLMGILALLPFIAERGSALQARLMVAAWLWLSIASLATYLFYSVGSTLYWAAVWVGWGGWAAGLLGAFLLGVLPRVMRRRAARKWDWISPHVAEPRRVLDLGAGEGYVGAEVARATGAEVVLADIVDFNRTELPLVTYDGHRLPFDDGAFDSTLLVFVLHHCERPEEVLAEVRRVTRGRVYVLESVVESEWDRRWLTFADRLANRLRSGGAMQDQEEHLAFGTVDEWRAAFVNAGFEVAREARRGRWVHKRHLFVLC